MKAVKFYSTMPSDDENVLLGISGKIPAEVVDLSVTPNYQIDETFVQMTDEEFTSYMNSIQAELTEWKARPEYSNNRGD